MILEKGTTLEEILALEVKWTRKLFAYQPTGLNSREEKSFDVVAK